MEWYVAADGAQSGPFSRTEAAKRIVAIGPSKVVHVWKEGMSGWKPPSEVSVLAREMNLLRPVPPLPPRAASATPAAATKASLTPTPAFHRAPGATPAPLHAAKRTEERAPPANQPAALGSPSVAPAAIDIVSPDGDADADSFIEDTTRKNQLMVPAAAAPASHQFADATTKRGKNLRDPGAEPAAVVSKIDDQRTPPPVHPLPSAVARPLNVVPIRPTLGEPPTLPNPSPFAMSGLDSGPAITFDTGDGVDVVTPPPAVVVAAMAAASSHASSTPLSNAISMEGIEPSMSGVDFAPKQSRLAELFQRQPGLKYVAAAIGLVVLVILLVLVNLRSDATKLPDAVKDPPKEEIAQPEEPKQPPVATAPAPAPEERSASGSHAGPAGPHHPAVKVRAVGPAVERPVAPKQPSKPARDDSARPNPFAEGVKTVSQSQISGVVRNPDNQSALRSCYERALKMDTHLTSGRMDVTVSIAASGVVQRVVVNAPASFILVEPCIKNAVKRWKFPASSEEYGTNFPLILQGGT